MIIFCFVPLTWLLQVTLEMYTLITMIASYVKKVSLSEQFVFWGSSELLSSDSSQEFSIKQWNNLSTSVSFCIFLYCKPRATGRFLYICSLTLAINKSLESNDSIYDFMLKKTDGLFWQSTKMPVLWWRHKKLYIMFLWRHTPDFLIQFF